MRRLSATMTIEYGSQSPRLAGLSRKLAYSRTPIAAMTVSRIMTGE